MDIDLRSFLATSDNDVAAAVQTLITAAKLFR